MKLLSGRPLDALTVLLAATFAVAALTGCGSGSSESTVDSGGGHEASSGHDAGKPHDASTKHDSGTIPDARPPSLDGWSVPTGCNPLAVTNECLLPYPSDFMTAADPTTPTGLRIAIPPHALVVPDAAVPIDMTPFNRWDGAPTSEPILVHFGVDVDASFLADDKHNASSVSATSPIALIDEATGERIPFLSEMDANYPSQTTRHALIIRPLQPLAFGTKYVVALTNALRDTSGKPLPESKGFIALRDKIPTSDATIEGARSRFEALFTFVAAHGYARDSLALAWDYTTASNHAVIGPITTMRERVFAATTVEGPPLPDGGADAAKDGSTDAGIAVNPDAGDTISYEITSVTASPYVAGANIIEGTFTPPNYLKADNTILYDGNNVPVLQTTIPAPSYPFTMIVPPLGATQSLSLVVFGHGIFGSGRDYLTTSYGKDVQPLTQSLGGVVIATDWIGLSSNDFNIILNNVPQNLNNIGIVTDRLLQAIVNNLSLIELSLGALQADPRVKLSSAQPLLDPSRVYYYGVSLGGVEGSSFISVSRNITRAAVAVPGASWSNLLARSVDYQQFEVVIQATYPDPLLQQEFIALLQARFDPADPINLATLFQTNPLPNSPASRTAVLQESIGDCQVPNLTTELLARAYGALQITPDIVPIYGLSTVTTPTTKASVAQFEILSDIAKYVPPTTNVTPTMDNNAHSDMPFEGPALVQVVDLLSNGTIVQNCPDAGPCVLP